MRGVRSWVAAGIVALAGCVDGSGRPGGGRAETVDAFVIGPVAATGWAEHVAFYAEPLYAAPVVHLYRQDDANPNLLVDVATLDAPAGLTSLHVNAQYLTTFGGGTGGGWVRATALAAPHDAPVVAAVPARVTAAIAWNGSIVAASGATLRQYAIDGATATLAHTHEAGAPITALVGVDSGVYVFTATGYGFLGYTGESYLEDARDDVARFTAAAAYDGHLYVSGPSRYAGKFTVGRLDVTEGGGLAPALLETIADVGTFGADVSDAAYDAATGEHDVLAETTDGTYEVGVILRFADGATGPAELAPARLDVPVCTVFCGGQRLGVPRVHAYRGRVYAVAVQHPQAAAYTFALP